jgi:hypothetical protein
MGRTFHGFRLGERTDDMPHWLKLVDSKYPRSNDPRDKKPISAEDFDHVIGDCGAVTDMPCAAFWRELMDAYPEAKIVLVERDVDAWFPSFKQIVVDGMMSRKGQIFANHWVGTFVGDLKIEMMFRIFLKYFEARDRHELAANAKRIYLEHNNAIKQACKEQNRPFLVYRLGDGWKPLCDFLEVDVPKNVPFPRGNEAKVMSELTHKIQWERIYSLVWKMQWHASLITLLTAAVWNVWKYFAFVSR